MGGLSIIAVWSVAKQNERETKIIRFPLTPARFVPLNAPFSSFSPYTLSLYRIATRMDATIHRRREQPLVWLVVPGWGAAAPFRGYRTPFSLLPPFSTEGFGITTARTISHYQPIVNCGRRAWYTIW